MPKVDEKLFNTDEFAEDATENPVEPEENNSSDQAQAEINSKDTSPSGIPNEAAESAEEESTEDEQKEQEDAGAEDSEEVEYEQESFNLYPTSEDAEEYPDQTADLPDEPQKDDEKEIILSPDELFKDGYLDSKNDFEEEDFFEEQEEIVEEDGQYRIAYADESMESEEFEDEEEEVEFEEEEEAPKYNPKKPRRIDSHFDFVELFIFTLLAVMIVTSFFFRHSIVDGESMEGTLHAGEHLIISDFLYTPERGDIVVCEDYTTPIKKPIVKRVIAIEGDTVRITENGEVYVNDKLLDESAYIYIDDPYYTHEALSVEVKKGEIFVMGDHRNQSTDSRNEAVGTLSVDSVIGKVLLRFYPFNKFGTVN
jgi:signal peptidase I